MHHGTHVASLFAGCWRDAACEPPSPPLPVSMLRAWERLPVLEEQHARMLGEVLSALGHGLLHALEEERDRPVGTRHARIEDFVRRHAHEPVRLAELARQLGLSPSRASHVVKDLFGTTFRRLLHEERLRRAHALLISTDLTVNEIADRVGYTNPYHLIRVFKKEHGMPPGRYRARFSRERADGSSEMPRPR
jgi:AraC-like DNA-binding protein